MCEAFDYYENRGIQKGIQEEKQERQKWLLEIIKRNMLDGFSFQQMVKLLGISPDQQDYYFKKLQE